MARGTWASRQDLGRGSIEWPRPVHMLTEQRTTTVGRVHIAERCSRRVLLYGKMATGAANFLVGEAVQLCTWVESGEEGH